MRAITHFLLPLALSLSLHGDPHNPTNVNTSPTDLDLTEIFVGMDSDDFKSREEATFRLLELSRTRLEAVAQALFEEARTTDNPEVRFRSKDTFRRIFQFRILGKGDANLGVQWQWHIQLGHEGEMRARPLARHIQEDSLAAQAGLKEGDFVCYVNGEELPRRNGIPALRKILRAAAPGEKVTLKLRSVKLQNRRLTSKPSPEREVIITMQDTQKGLREAKPGEFEKWYTSLQALYDIST